MGLSGGSWRERSTCGADKAKIITAILRIIKIQLKSYDCDGVSDDVLGMTFTGMAGVASRGRGEREKDNPY